MPVQVRRKSGFAKANRFKGKINPNESELPSSSDSEDESISTFSIKKQSKQYKKANNQINFDLLSIGNKNDQDEVSIKTLKEKGTELDDEEKEFTSFIKDHFDIKPSQYSNQDLIQATKNRQRGMGIEQKSKKDKKFQKKLNLSEQKFQSLDLDFYYNLKSSMNQICLVCDKALINKQILVCINGCDHFYHEDCLIEAIISTKDEATGKENFRCLKCLIQG